MKRPIALTLLVVPMTLVIACPPTKDGDVVDEQPQKEVLETPPQKAATATAAAEVNTTPNATTGKKLFMTGCVNCHGLDGTGALMRQMMPKIGDLTSTEMHSRLKDEDIENLIKNGRDKMPPFGEAFREDQIRSIVAYVRTMKKG